jgi:hypothetical protein
VASWRLPAGLQLLRLSRAQVAFRPGSLTRLEELDLSSSCWEREGGQGSPEGGAGAAAADAAAAAAAAAACATPASRGPGRGGALAGAVSQGSGGGHAISPAVAPAQEPPVQQAARQLEPVQQAAVQSAALPAPALQAAGQAPLPAGADPPGATSHAAEALGPALPASSPHAPSQHQPSSSGGPASGAGALGSPSAAVGGSGRRRLGPAAHVSCMIAMQPGHACMSGSACSPLCTQPSAAEAGLCGSRLSIPSRTPRGPHAQPNAQRVARGRAARLMQPLPGADTHARGHAAGGQPGQLAGAAGPACAPQQAAGARLQHPAQAAPGGGARSGWRRSRRRRQQRRHCRAFGGLAPGRAVGRLWAAPSAELDWPCALGRQRRGAWALGRLRAAAQGEALAGA